MRRVGFAVAALAIILGGAAKGTTLDAASVNGAQWSGRDAEALDPALVHAPTLPRRTWRTLRVVRAHSVTHLPSRNRPLCVSCSPCGSGTLSAFIGCHSKSGESAVSERTTKPLHKADNVTAKSASPSKREKLVDEALEKTFPASDPPSYMGGSTTGGPRRGTFRSDDVTDKARRKLQQETNRR